MQTAYMVEKMHQMASTIRDTADDIDRYAENLERTGDWSNVSEVAAAVSNMVGALRLDLLVAIPLREMGRESAKSESEK